MEKRFVYADHSATTPISKPVLNAMLPYLTEGYGNPSSIYSKGREAKKALESARGRSLKRSTPNPRKSISLPAAPSRTTGQQRRGGGGSAEREAASHHHQF